MIPFEELDSRLLKLGKDRSWLAEVTPYSADYIRTVLAPNSTRRTDRVLRILSEAIEKEETAQGSPTPAQPPGYSSIFLDDDQLDRAEQASRLGPWESLADFCRDAILQKADELLASQDSATRERKPVTYPAAGKGGNKTVPMITGLPAASRKVADEAKPSPKK